MSESELPDTSDDSPRFRRPEQRRRVALAKYYGTGSDGEWSIEQIAEYLKVEESTVEGYIYNTEIGDRVREMFPAAEERMKMDILLEKKDRLDELRDLFTEKMKEKEAAVTSHELESVRAEMNFEDIEGLRAPTGEGMSQNTVRLDAPKPSKFEERAVFDEEARALLREIRKHENDIREMMSLDEPDEVRTEHTGDAVVEQKIYNFNESDEMPEAQVVDVEAQEVDTSMVGEPDE